MKKNIKLKSTCISELIIKHVKSSMKNNQSLETINDWIENKERLTIFIEDNWTLELRWMLLADKSFNWYNRLA